MQCSTVDFVSSDGCRSKRKQLDGVLRDLCKKLKCVNSYKENLSIHITKQYHISPSTFTPFFTVTFTFYLLIKQLVR